MQDRVGENEPHVYAVGPQHVWMGESLGLGRRG